MRRVVIKVPTRLSVTVLDMNKLKRGKVGGGGIGISPAHYIKITITQLNQGNDIVFAMNNLVVHHYIKLFRNMFTTQSHYRVNIESDVVAHCGEGSTTATICGLLRGLSEIHGIELSDEELISIYYSGIMEEHEGRLLRGYASGMGAWNVIYGGIVLVDEMANLVKDIRIDEGYQVLIVRPIIMNRISYKAESTLIDGVGKLSDNNFSDEKYNIFARILEQSGDNNTDNQREILRMISTFNEIGSKIDEFRNANELNDGLLLKLRDEGCRKAVALHGLSSLGPTYYYVDEANILSSICNSLDREKYVTHRYDVSKGMSTSLYG